MIYLSLVEKYLIEENSVGIKTLDPDDYDYVPYYDNSNDSDDRTVAQGFSYHNGPEWGWLYGFFLEALIQMKKGDKDFTPESIFALMTPQKKHLLANEWYSIPEVTNANGQFCSFSCPAQAWSVATLLEVCYDLRNLK